MIDDPRQRRDGPRLPLPSEDTGDLLEEPPSGMTDDHLVAREEGIPYDPPSERVLTQPRSDRTAADQAGTAPDDAGELERVDDIQPAGEVIAGQSRLPTDDELQADVIEALRASDLPAGERLQVAVDGRRVSLRGEVESIDILDEIIALVGEVPGVDDVIDEVRVHNV
jgi:hypothetical protein